MRLGGWLLLLGSTIFVWSLTIWCYYKVLSAPAEDFTKPPDSLGG